MDWQEELNEQSEGLDFQSLNRMKSDEKICSSIDYTRPLEEYATAQDISMFLQMRDNAVHVYTKDLNKNGVAIQDAMETYLAKSEYLSSGVLKEAIKSPLHLYYAKESGWKEELEKYQGKKNHFELGTYLHECILEPTKFKRVCVEPDFKLNSLDGVRQMTEFWKEQIKELGEIEHDGKAIDAETAFKVARIAVDQMGLDYHLMNGKRAFLDILKKISQLQAVTQTHKLIISCVYQNYQRYGNGVLFELMKRSKREISLYYTDPSTGLKLRVRPDAMQFEENIGCNAIISVKSTRCESIDHFAYDSAKLRYEVGEAMYLDVASGVTGRDFRAVITIMLQTIPPFGVAALVWNAEDLEIGKYKYRQALQTVVECQEKNHYPGYDAMAESGNLGLINFKQPSWNAKELHPVEIDN